MSEILLLGARMEMKLIKTELEVFSRELLPTPTTFASLEIMLQGSSAIKTRRRSKLARFYRLLLQTFFLFLCVSRQQTWKFFRFLLWGDLQHEIWSFDLRCLHELSKDGHKLCLTNIPLCWQLLILWKQHETRPKQRAFYEFGSFTVGRKRNSLRRRKKLSNHPPASLFPWVPDCLSPALFTNINQPEISINFWQ